MAVSGARVIPRWTLAVAGVAALVGLLVFQMLRPLPAVAATLSSAPGVVAGAPPLLPWPAKGEAAVGTGELGLVGVTAAEQPRPMASVAKVMTALVVLQDKPLAIDNPGPAITIEAPDVADFESRRAAGESVVKVAAGEQLSEFDALQGLLIPSGNNIAAVLAKWDAGSVDAMVSKMNARATAMGLVHTSFADPAGVSARTTSNPRDLFRLGVEALSNPVLAKVVAEVQANLPVAGVVYNVDYILGQDGIIGVKTGSGPDFGANFVFASKQTVAGQGYTIYGAVMGAETLEQAFSSTKALIDAVKPAVGVFRVAEGDAVATYQAPWGARAQVRAGKGLTYLSWPGMKIRRTVSLAALTPPVEAGHQVGHLDVSVGLQLGSVPLLTASPLGQPSRGWRLTRIR